MKKLIWLLPVLGSLSCISVGAEDKLMKPYPAPEAGYRRWVFTLEGHDQEENFKVEILPGKVMTVDCNKVRLGGELVEKTAQGWGYHYYVLENAGPAISTKMACSPGFESRETFVAVSGDKSWIRYNSKLPVVVYVPDGYQVHYRIWQAGEEQTAAAR